MKRNNRSLLIAGAFAIASFANGASAQQPPGPDPTPRSGTESETRPDGDRDRTKQVQRFGSDYLLESGETAREVVVVQGDATIDGTVLRDVVSILGAARLGGAARIEGDLVVLLGSLRIESGAVVEGDLVVVGGDLDAPVDFQPGGEMVSVGRLAALAPATTIPHWLSEGFLWGRPLVPDLPWVWIVLLVSALIYLAVNFLFERPVRDCAAVLADKPLTTCIVGVLVLALIVPVTGVLVMSIIGVPLIPFLWLALVLVGSFGRVSVFRWIGARVVPESLPGAQLPAARSLVIGMAAVCLLYAVPGVGFLAWTTVGVFGLGAAATTVFAALRKEHPPAPPADGPRPDDPDPEEEGEDLPASNGLTDYPLAGFGPRLAAVVVDALVLGLLVAILDTRWVLLTVLTYHIVLWGWKTTTIGGLVCRVRLVRTDRARLQFSDALVRGLSCIISVVVAGLGWLWILWDPKSQAWHDKIAGTYVVRVPPDVPLP